MSKRKLLWVITILIAGLLFSGLNGQAASIKERMLARVPTINSLKDQGLIGENNKGFLEYRSGAKPEQKLINNENNDRKSVYAAIAKKQQVDLSLVGQRRAKQISDKGRKGHWFQRPDGTWYKK